MNGSLTTRLVGQSTTYLIGSALVSLSGVISFPIWTRIFSQSQYGEIALVAVTITLMESIAKLGLQHSALRFYPSYVQEEETQRKTYYSTLFFGSIAFAMIGASLIFFFGAMFLPSSGNMRLIVSVIAFVVGSNGTLTTFLRAKQSVVTWNLVNVVRRFGSFAVSLAIVLLLFRSATGFYLGVLVVEIGIWVVLSRKLFVEESVGMGATSYTFLSEAVKYGLPLVLFEFVKNILSLGDRYLIKLYLGYQAVGLYSAGYNLCTYVVDIISSPLRLAIMPILFSTWEKKGKVGCEKLVSDALNIYFMVAIPMFFGLNVLGKEIMQLAAGPKFLEAYKIIPYVSGGLVINGVFFIWGASLYIKKETLVLLIISATATTINLVLNVILIPRFGLTGSAGATLVAYFVFNFLLFAKSRELLAYDFSDVKIIKFIFGSLVMLVMIKLIVPRQWNLISTVIIGAVSYFGTLLIIDKKVNGKAREVLRYVSVRIFRSSN